MAPIDILDSAEENDEELIRCFIGDNADYYLGYYRRHGYGLFTSYHFPALFLGIFWMFYRKMYWEAFLYFFVFLGAWVLTYSYFQVGGIATTTSGYIDMIFLLIHIFLFPSLANSVYLQKVKRNIMRSKQKYSEMKKVENELRLKGGTSLVLIFFIITFFALSILRVFFG